VHRDGLRSDRSVSAYGVDPTFWTAAATMNAITLATLRAANRLLRALASDRRETSAEPF